MENNNRKLKLKKKYFEKEEKALRENTVWFDIGVFGLLEINSHPKRYFESGFEKREI